MNFIQCTFHDLFNALFMFKCDICRIIIFFSLLKHQEARFTEHYLLLFQAGTSELVRILFQQFSGILRRKKLDAHKNSFLHLLAWWILKKH